MGLSANKLGHGQSTTLKSFSILNPKRGRTAFLFAYSINETTIRKNVFLENPWFNEVALNEELQFNYQVLLKIYWFEFGIQDDNK